MARLARVGLGSANRASLEAFIARNPACPVQVKTARDELLVLVEKEQQAACARNFSKVSGKGNEAALTNFIRANARCSKEIAEAYREIDTLASAERACRQAFARAKNQDTSQAMLRFLQEFAHCSAQVPSATTLLVDLQRKEDEINNQPPPNPYPYDGVYVGRRGYTDSSRPSKSKWCLSRYNFTMTVQNHYVSFNSDGRYWQGYIDDQGYIAIEHGGITPAPNHQTFIRGPLNNAQLYNGYCGYGYFTVQRQ